MATSATAKTIPSPADLAALEHSFATDPSSDAYRPLAEAYLAMGRFMEAMVVCKKGVRAHPETPDARVLLARVYAEQGKDKKALEELQLALQTAPKDGATLRMAGHLLFKSGDAAAGKDHLLRAYQAAPNEPETQEALKRWNVEPPTAEPATLLVSTAQPPTPSPSPVTPTAPAPAAVPMAGPGAMATVRQREAGVARPPAPAPGLSYPPASAPAPEDVPILATALGRPKRPAAEPPPAPHRPSRPPSRPTQRRAYEDLAARYGDEDEPAKKRGGGGAITVLLVLAVAGGLVGWNLYTRHMAEQRRAIDKLLKETGEQLQHDTFAAYKKACDSADKILELDPENLAAHAYSAYAYALRWGEHGEGDEAAQQAREHLRRAEAQGQEHSHIYAARGYVKYFSGEGAEAQAQLEQTVKDLEEHRKASGLIYGTLGILEMNGGDLDKAKDSLTKANSLAQADPRVYAAIGDLYRRRGQDFLASTNYENALRYEKEHAEALVGLAIMMVESEPPKVEQAKEQVKRILDLQPPPSPRHLALTHMVRALALAIEGSADEAQREDDRAFALSSRDGELYSLRSERLLRLGQGDAALKAIQEATRIEPRRASYYVDLSRILMNRPGGAKEAIDHLSKALVTLKDDPKLRVLLGDAYRVSGDKERAKSTYEKVIADAEKARNTAPDAKIALGMLYRERKDWTKAVDLFDKAANELVTNPDRAAAARLEIARTHEEKGDTKAAVDAYSELLGKAPDYAPAYYFFGRCLASDRATKAKAVVVLNHYLGKAPRGSYAAEAKRLLTRLK